MNTFDLLYRSIFLECMRFGEVKGLFFLENLDPALRGHVYIVYHREDDAQRAADNLKNRRIDGREIRVDFVEVQDLEREVCQMVKVGKCTGRYFY